MFERYEMEEDDQLALMAQDGDEAALEFLIRKFTPLIWKQARQFYGQGIEAEDLVQEGFLVFLRAVQRFEPAVGAVFYSYVQSSIRNGLIYAVRSLNRGGAGALPVQPEKFFNKAEFSYIPVMTWDNQSDFVQEALVEAEFLSEMEKECLKLFLDGYNYTEIAEILETSLKAVDNALGRCRVKLKKMCKLKGYAPQNYRQY